MKQAVIKFFKPFRHLNLFERIALVAMYLMTAALSCYLAVIISHYPQKPIAVALAVGVIVGAPIAWRVPLKDLDDSSEEQH